MPRVKNCPTKNKANHLLGPIANSSTAGHNGHNKRKKYSKYSFDDEFADFLKRSHFYLTIHNQDVSVHKSAFCVIESFDLIFPDGMAEILNDIFYIYVAEDMESMVYYQLKDGLNCRHKKVNIQSQNFNISLNLLHCLSHKNSFILTSDTQSFSKNSNQQDKITISIWLHKTNVQATYFSSSINPNKNIKSFMDSLLKINPTHMIEREPPLSHVEHVFDQVKKFHDQDQSRYEKWIKPPNLLPTLRPYQIRAIQWMLWKEKSHPNLDSVNELHHLFVPFESLYYNTHGGYFVIEKPLKIESTSGGLLCDEMGLGKTLEVLSCILLNEKKIFSPKQQFNRTSFQKYFECICGIANERYSKKPTVSCLKCGSTQHAKCVNYDLSTLDTNSYLCAHCWASPEIEAIESRATLIVSPSSIIHQWTEEIVKHIDCSNLDIYTYEGVASNQGYIQPYDLANKDIVITTYETLRQELNFVNLPTGNRFRNPKRFNSTPTPLLAVKWWRICLDEAQLVEGASTKVAEMALKLKSYIRWCITGTPVQKSVNDLFGLFLFIREDPFHEKLWWNSLLYKNYCKGDSLPLVNALSSCFWRSSKKDIWNEIGIPEQKENTLFISFSPVEEHFYKRIQNQCSNQFLDKISKLSDLAIKLKDLDKKTASKLIIPLLKLRQACCHPQLIRGKFAPITKKTLTMEELLETMIKNTKYECEEEHRKLTAALNGQSAIHIIQGDYVKAVERYRDVLQSIGLHKEKFRTDKLQKFHTLYNLAQVLESCGINQKRPVSRYGHLLEPADFVIINSTEEADQALTQIGRTLNDENILEEAENLRSEYLSKDSLKIDESKSQLKLAMSSVDEVGETFILPKNKKLWWDEALRSLASLGDDVCNNLVQKVKETLLEHDLRGRKSEALTFTSISNKFRDINGLQYVLHENLKQLEKCRLELTEKVNNLPCMPNKSEVNEAVDCHLRKSKDKNERGRRFKCKFCKINELFNAYEAKIFYFSQTEKVEESEDALMEKLRRGTWGDSESEQALKVILNIFKNKHSLPNYTEIMNDGNNHIKYYEALKKEFRALRGVWMNFYDFISSIDEINMAAMRFRLRYPDEPEQEEPAKYILDRQEIPNMLIDLRSDETISRNELKRKLSHLYYLQSMIKASSGRKGGLNPEICPICQLTLGSHWSVFCCGHSVCMKCLDVYINEYSIRTGSELSIRCPLCRQLTKLADLLYVNSNANEEMEEENIKIRGSWSTKVEAVIKCLIKINQEDDKAKSLVFSSWNDVLTLLSKACEDNNISFVHLKSSTNFSQTIDEFKHKDTVKVMLLPISCGSKGLNLTEATHVLLTEPLLNPASEDQAVGRVHRIGQTRITHVHRFIVKNTLEERIYEMFKNNIGIEGNLSGNIRETSENAMITIKDIQKLFTGT